MISAHVTHAWVLTHGVTALHCNLSVSVLAPPCSLDCCCSLSAFMPWDVVPKPPCIADVQLQAAFSRWLTRLLLACCYPGAPHMRKALALRLLAVLLACWQQPVAAGARVGFPAVNAPTSC